MRLIDGDALKDRLQSLADDDWNQGVITSWADAYHECADMVDDQPTIEPERKTGRLIHEPAYNWYRCSVCKKVYSEALLQNFNECMYQPCFSYCPNCGARMEEGGE